MTNDLEQRLQAIEARSLAQSIAISAAMLTVFQKDQVGMRALRDTICDGIERAYERDNSNHSFLQIALDEAETLFRLFKIDDDRSHSDRF